LFSISVEFNDGPKDEESIRSREQTILELGQLLSENRKAEGNTKYKINLKLISIFFSSLTPPFLY
jgi:hypothetical protein